MDPIVKAIPLSQIQPSPHQARKAFDTENLKGLAESMRQEGLLNPVVVRKVAAGFELISGERRLRAAKLLGWPTLEAKVIGTVSEAEAAAKGLIENIQREDLNTIEEAEGYKELNRLDPKYWNQNKIAQNCGKTQGHVSEFLRFLTLPEPIKGYIRRRILTAGHAAELIRMPRSKDQKALAQRIIKGKLSVMQTRDAVDRKLGKKLLSDAPAKAPIRMEDPLSEVWLSLQNDSSIAAQGSWGVSYGFLRSPQLGEGVMGWTFMLPNTSALSQIELAQWFRCMADAIHPSAHPVEEIVEQTPVQHGNGHANGNGHSLTNGHSNGHHENGHSPANGNGNGHGNGHAPAVEAPASPVVRVIMPSNETEVDTIRRERENIRLPKTPQEEAELEALAIKGPYAVYQWMYGADSLTANKVVSRTWAELGMNDPAIAVRGMVRALRTIQQLLKR